MTATPESPALAGEYDRAVENNTAFEVLHGLYGLKIAEVSAAYQQAEPDSEAAHEHYRLLEDLVRARDLLHPDRPDTLELGQLIIKQMGLPESR